MSSQDRLENVLRDFHVMISKSEVYDTERIIVRKNAVFDLIDRLNACIYEIMDEYEMTQQSRDKALREHKKEGDKIIWDASRQAEDIYAASVMYTQEALNRLNRVVEDANMTISHLYREFSDSMKQQQETIRENESELKSQLQLLSDTDKYMSLIGERNREIEREEAEKKGRKIVHAAEKAAVKPEIKINEEYFKKAGIPLDGYVEKKPVQEEGEMQSLADEGVVESSFKKEGAEAISKREAADENMPGQGDVSALEIAGEDMPVEKGVSGRKIPDQEESSQKAINREGVGPGYAGKEYSGQEYAEQEYSGQEYVGQEYTVQGMASQEFPVQGMTGQEYAIQEMSDQEYVVQGMSSQEYSRQNTDGQKMQAGGFEPGEGKKDSKEGLSFFDKLMGKKN